MSRRGDAALGGRWQARECDILRRQRDAAELDALLRNAGDFGRMADAIGTAMVGAAFGRTRTRREVVGK